MGSILVTLLDSETPSVEARAEIVTAASRRFSFLHVKGIGARCRSIYSECQIKICTLILNRSGKLGVS